MLVPSYDIEKQTTIFFKSERAKASADSDFLMRDVARATSRRADVLSAREDRDGRSAQLLRADRRRGGRLGNPAMCAYAEAVKMGHAVAGPDPDPVAGHARRDAASR